jgi:hypothetical protein
MKCCTDSRLIGSAWFMMLPCNHDSPACNPKRLMHPLWTMFTIFTCAQRMTKMKHKQTCGMNHAPLIASFHLRETHTRHASCSRHDFVQLSWCHASIMISCKHHDVMRTSWFHAIIMISCEHHDFMRGSWCHASIMISCEHHDFMRASWFHASIMISCEHHDFMRASGCHASIRMSCEHHDFMRASGCHANIMISCEHHDVMQASWIRHLWWFLALSWFLADSMDHINQQTCMIHDTRIRLLAHLLSPMSPL